MRSDLDHRNGHSTLAPPPRDAVAVATPTQPGEAAAFGEPSIWGNRHFLLLWLAQAISQTAQNAIWFGIVVLVEQLSHSSTQLSIAILTLII
ncbi:MAG TPA: hypothetical protein VGK33_21760, partial [Chloroflexota bacterium]